MGLQVIAIDTGDEKRDMTKKLGAEKFVDFAKSENLVKDVQAATEDGMGPHAVLLVAVSEKPFQQAAEVSKMMIIQEYQRFAGVMTTNLDIVRPTTRNRRCHWSPSWRLPQSSCLRNSHQDDHHQGILCW